MLSEKLAREYGECEEALGGLACALYDQAKQSYINSREFTEFITFPIYLDEFIYERKIFWRDEKRREVLREKLCVSFNKDKVARKLNWQKLMEALKASGTSVHSRSMVRKMWNSPGEGSHRSIKEDVGKVIDEVLGITHNEEGYDYASVIDAMSYVYRLLNKNRLPYHSCSHEKILALWSEIRTKNSWVAHAINGDLVALTTEFQKSPISIDFQGNIVEVISLVVCWTPSLVPVARAIWQNKKS